MSHHDDFVSGAPGHLHRARAFLASAASAGDPDTRAFFLARARGEYELAAADLKSLEIILAAREKEIARTGAK